jgi:hypothetical protein
VAGPELPLQPIAVEPPAALRLKQRRALEWVLLLLAAVFYVLTFVHLRADFPNFSPWNDWSKMTDEGWYGGGAVHHFVQGSWFLPGSFNPAVAMPVWPLMLALWFKLTGVGMVAARSLTVLVYGVSLGLLYTLVRRASHGLAAACAITLMAVNPFCYAFDRLAILEPLLILWLLAGLLIADRTRLSDTVRPVLLGLIIALLVFTKATGLFLAPAIVYHVWAVNGWPRRGWFRPAAGIAGSAAVLGLGYYLLAVWPHHLEDFRLLFSINQDRIHLSIFPQEALGVLLSGRWINPILFPAALLALLWSITSARNLLRIPLFGSAIVAAVGYLTFIAYHTNLQPRYYLVVTPAVIIVLVLTVATLWQQQSKVAAAVCTLALIITGIFMAARTLHVVAHPEYSFASAADDIARKIRSQPNASPILLSNSGDDITLFTGIPALTLEYSTHGIDPVIDRFHPGWLAIWSGSGDASHPVQSGREYPWLARVAERYRLAEVAHYTVFDDPARNHLFLYRLSPLRAGATESVTQPNAENATPPQDHIR